MNINLVIGSCGLTLIVLLQLASAVTTGEREAYFNGSAYLRLNTPMPIWKHSAISVRSCKGGEILSHSYRNHELKMFLLADEVLITMNVTTPPLLKVRVPAHLLDNQWHTIEFLYQLGVLNLIIDKQMTVIANSTYNTILLTDPELPNDAAVPILGRNFSGCMLAGPGFLFSDKIVRAEKVSFGPCPLAPGLCQPDERLIDIPIDFCINKPCMTHGQCISRENRYECHCTHRYSGKNCEVDTGPQCSPGPCRNGGTCTEDSIGNYQCSCLPNYTGTHCEIEISPLCANFQCENNGTCRVLGSNNRFECDCLPGFSGTRCEIDWNECESQPCQNDGQCVDDIGMFRCNCEGTGYSGVMCQNNIDECALSSSTCMNSGQCFDTYGSFICACLPGFGGHRCEQPINECLSVPCAHAATCVDLKGGRFECICPPGYSGEYCQVGPPCQHDCGPDAECKGDKCVCKQDASGHCLHNTTTTPKLAQSNACNCLNGATCSGTSSNFSCICASGFEGVRCESAVRVTDNCNCLNGGICNNTQCICPNGFEGNRCERAETCNSKSCLDPMNCVGGKCVCPENVNCSLPCADDYPCLNGGTCHIRGGQYYCKCPSGFNGSNCETNIYECSPSKNDPNHCHNGFCFNHTGLYKCYCEPGYTGIFCDADVDECLSHPCKNDATCQNLVNDYKCICPPGYDGKDCSLEINECDSNPCFVGSTCIDLVANFSCNCISGMTGRLCDINIDDCEPQPCMHNGTCKDRLDGYLCNCSSTGFTGDNCEIPIDECDPSQCINNATCTDLVNDYQCNCFAGYDGKNCENDIDECAKNPCQNGGECYQRSNRALYQTGPYQHFREQFSYERASGYECICVNGIEGENCEININECASNPCRFGKCIDGIGRYTCECNAGYEGPVCEIEINECDRYQPCLHGHCDDRIGTYLCNCDTLWGGQNCSVALTGCLDQPCLNNGECQPSLEKETIHSFNCSCDDGFQGVRCEKITTISLVKDSLLTVNTTRSEGYDISLRFKTTLPNGILVFGSGGQYSYILELVNGKLNLHSSLLNKWEGVFIGSSLNDSNWHKVFVAINASHLLLSANEETTIYPISPFDNNNASNYTTFPVTYLGGTIPHLSSYLRHLTHAPSSFVGCMEDVVINGQWIFPTQPNANQSLINISPGCPRTAQCKPNPCHSGGHCIDQWHTFMCSCQRPHLGSTCQYNITAATFGNENTNRSTVVVNVADSARRTVRSVFDISMFIKTHQSTGQVFYLGSDPNRTADTIGQSFVSAKLQSGELLVKIQFNGSPEEQPVGGNRLDNGYTHLLQVVRNLTLVQVKINGTEYFRKTLSSTGPLDAEVLFLGGPPPTADTTTTTFNSSVYFKGIIQDVQVSNGTHPMTVELFPLNEIDLIVPPSFGDVQFDETSILKGIVTDDLCKTQPCHHDAICKNTWNDFECMCPRGYKGKLCQDIKFCELQDCPGQAICQNLEDGFECITNMTFQGNQAQPLAFSFYQKNNTSPTVPIDTTIEISYRTKTGGTLMYVVQDDMYFSVGAYKEQVTVNWRLSADLPETKRFHKQSADFEWSTIFIRVTDAFLEGGFSGWQDNIVAQPALATPIDSAAFFELFSGKNMFFLGGAPLMENSYIPKGDDKGAKFKGCLGEARIGGLLLPYFKHSQIYNDSFRERPHFRLNSPSPEEGCILCVQQDCKHGGVCTNVSDSYACTCPAGYEADDCSRNIDECLTATCQNNSTCIDLIANYTCNCQPGYEGRHCESEIDECLSAPCHNGGICHNLIASFSCECTEEYAGPQCDVLRQVTCENAPCRNGSTCTDGHNATTGNNFTCTCRPGLEGALCDIPFCTVTPCENGGFCLTTDATPVCQCSFGYAGTLCQTDINECASTPCQNGGICMDEIGHYRCRCNSTGFEGVNCENDIDECALKWNRCGPSGQCINTRGSFKCQCETGLCGHYCNVLDPCTVDTCANGGVCVEECGEEPDYFCNCTNQFIGKNCTEVASLREDGISPTDIAIIVVPIIVGLLVIAGIALTVFFMMARNKRATRGTYSPSAQEYCNPRLEMDNVLKPPPEERLI